MADNNFWENDPVVKETAFWENDPIAPEPTVRPPGALPVEPAFSREIAETDVPLGSVGRGIESGGALLGRGAGGLVEHLEAGGPGGYIARKVLGEKVGGTLGRIGGYALTPLAKIVGGVSRLAGGGVDEALAGDTGRTTTEYFKQSGEAIGERQAKYDPGAYSFQLSQGAVSTVPSLVAAPAGLTGMAIAAGTQVFGNTLADAADAYEKQGMTRQQAMDKAAPWALLDGLQTALLTRLVPGGESAIASVFRKEGAAAAQNFGEQVIKNYFKNSVARMGARVAKEGALEGVEEAMNQALSGAISKWSYAPEKSWEQIWEETKLGGSLGIALGGMMGGAGIVLGGREQAQPEIPPPPVQPNYFQQEPLAGRMADIERGYNPAFGQVPITPRTRNRIEPPVFESGQVPVPWMSGLVPRDTIFETPRIAPPDAPNTALEQVAEKLARGETLRGEDLNFVNRLNDGDRSRVIQMAENRLAALSEAAINAPPIAESYFQVPSQGGAMPVYPTFGETLPQPSTQPTEPYASPILSGEKVVPKARLSGKKGKGDRGSRLEQAASRQPEPVAARAEGEAAKAPELMTPEEYMAANLFGIGRQRQINRRLMDDKRRLTLKAAFEQQKPVNAKSYDSLKSVLKLELPAGYIRSGDQYVYQPTKQPAVESSGQTGEVSQPPPKPRMEDYKGSDNIITAFGRADDAWEESVKKWVAEQPENKAIIFQGENSTFAVTKDPKGGWRFTYFSNTDHMVTGHDEHKTREAAVIELLRMWGPMKRVAKMPFEVVPLPDRMFPGDEVIWRTKTGTEEPVNFRGFLGGSDAGKAVVVTSRGSQVTVDALDLKRKPQPKEVKTDEEKRQEGLQVNQPVEQPIKPAVEVPGEGSASLPPQSPTQLPPVVSIRDSLGQKHFWAKTRKEIEQELKDQVKYLKSERASINKLKGSKGYATWRLRSSSRNLKQDIEHKQQYYKGLLEVHKERVMEALQEGNPVPPEVLADYPDLKPKETTPAPTPATPSTPKSRLPSGRRTGKLPAALKKEAATPEPVKQKQGFDTKAAKEQKRYLLEEVDKAIADAPETRAVVPADADMAALDDVRMAKAGEDFVKFGERERATVEALANKYGVPWDKEKSGSSAIGQAYTKTKFNEVEGKIQDAILKQSNTILINVPGDGKFTLFNSKTALRDFKERAKRFPTTAPKQSFPSKPRLTPTTVPPTGKMVAESIAKAAAIHASIEPTRRIINLIYSDGKVTVATDGRRLIQIDKGLGGTPENPKLFREDGKPLSKAEMEEVGQFPNWKQVVPLEENLFAAFKGLDIERLNNVLQQANQATSEQQNSVNLYRNPDGSIAVTSATTDFGDYQHNLQDGAKILGAYDPKYLVDAIKAAKLLGNEKVDIWYTDDRAPVVIKANGMKVIIMPMRTASTDHGPEGKTDVNILTRTDIEGKPPSKRKAEKPVEQPTSPATAQPTVTPSAIKTESVNRAEIVTVGKGEKAPKDTDFVMAVSAAKNYFTLWFRSLEPGKRQDWRYVTILGRDQAEAHQRAQSAAERIASGDLTGLAFIGKEQLKVPKKIALLTYELTGDELMGVERMSIGEQAVGFGKHANILVKDLFRLQPDYAMWLVGNANFSRGRQIANYISALPEFIVSRDAKKVAAQEAVTGDNEEALKANKMSASANEVGTITLGGNTYDWKEQIKADGGRFDANNKAWYFAEPEQFTKFAERLRGITATSGGQGDRPAAYLANPRLRGLREAAKQSPDQSGFDKPIESYIGDETASLLRRGKGMGIPDVVIDEQVEDAARINRAYQLGKRLFLLTSEPGSGKTFVLGAAIRELKKSGAKNIVYVTLRQELITQIKEDLKAFGIDDVKFITYPALREMSPQSTDVLIFDEAHSVKNVGRDGDSAQQAAKAAQWIKQSKYTIFATATPFENPVQAEYLEPTGVFSDTFGDFMSFAEAFGASRYKLKSGNEVLVWKRRPSSDQDQSDARDWIRKQGIFTARRIRLPQGMVDSRLVNTQADPKIAEIYRQFTEAAEDNEDELVPFGKMWIKNFQKRLLESAKVSLGIVEAEAALKRGRNPIIFVETKAEREIDIPDLISKEAEWEQDVAMALKNNERPPPRSQYGLPPQGVVDVLRTFMEKTGMQKILIPSAEDLIVNHFGEGKVAIFTGSVTPAKAQKNLDDWRAGRKKIIVATMAKGGTGLSLHDKVGNHPTTQININLPWTATQVVQVAQRSARYGLQSKAEMEWLFADNIPFDRMLSARVGGRMADMGAVVHGARLEGSERIENWDFENSLFSDDKQAAAQAPAVIPEKPTAPPAEPTVEKPFKDWRVQGTTIRHSNIGAKLSESEAGQIMRLMEENGMRGRYVPVNGTVILNSGMTSDLIALWEKHGSYAKNLDKNEAEKQTINAKISERKEVVKQSLGTNPATDWINRVFGNDAMNDFNKLELAKYLTGETEKFGGQVSRGWLPGVESLGARAGDKVDFEKLKSAYQSSEPPLRTGITNIEGAGNENFEGEKSSLSKGMEPGVAQDMESTRTRSGEILWATKGEIAQILLNPSERAGRVRGDSGSAQGTQRTPEKIRVLIEKPEASMPLSGVRQAAATLLANRIVSGLGSSEAKTETSEGHFFKLLVNKLTGLKFVIREFGPLQNGQPDITPAMYQADKLGRFDVVSININQIGNIAESKELQALWDSMLIEEVIHAAASRLATRPEIEQVWNKLSDEERAKVNEFYDQEKTLDKPLDAFNGGHEYIRIILQERLTGRPTELSKFSISDVTKNILRRLLAELKSLFGAKPKNEFAREVIDRIEGAIKGEPPIPQPVVGLRDYAIEETAPTWYSRITRTVEQSPQQKASGAQWKAMIRNSKLGVSKDEYALVSVDDLEDGRTYTKSEVLDYLRANEVKVEDVTLGKGLTPVEEQRFQLLASDYEAGKFGLDSSLHEELSELQRKRNLPEGTTHFSTYQLPGGKEGSYREVLLTVGNLKNQFNTNETGAESFSNFMRRVGLNPDNSNDIEIGRSRYYNERFGSEKQGGTWRDGHSQYSYISNPIVRLRFNERTTADGKRMLFLEEVQAPQKGQFEKMPALFQKNWREIAFKWALRHAAENGFDSVGWTTGEMQAERYSLEKHISRLDWRYNPDARDFYITARDLQGNRVIDKANVKRDELDGVVGKEIAERILNTPQVAKADSMKGKSIFADGTIEGEGLKVGGEGLKKLYDVDFRNVVNGLPVVKKSGQKVGHSEFYADGRERSAYDAYLGQTGRKSGDTIQVQSITITPEMRDAVMAGQNMFSKANQSPAGWVEVEGNQPLTEADVRAAVDPILSNWQGVTFTLVNDPNWTSGGDSLIGGMRSGNEITLNLAAIGSKERAIALLLHEGVGHLGIRGALGADFVRVMDEVWNMMTPENHAEVVKLVKRYGSDRTNLTAEWVARQAEKGATGSTWQRIWQRVVDWFAKVFGRQNAEAIARDLFRQGSKWLRTNPAERVDGQADYSIEEATRAVETGGQANVPFAQRQAGAELVAAPFVRERLAEVTRIANDPNADQAQADSAKALLKNKTARKLLFGPAQKLEELEGNMGATVQTYEQSRQNPNLQPTEFQTVTLAALNSYNDFQKGVAEFLAGIEQQREAIIEMISKGRKKLGDIFTPGTKEYQKFVNRQSANQITDIIEDGVNHAATAVARETARRVVQHKVAVQNAVVWILNNIPNWRTFTNPAELLAQVKETAGADWMQAVGANAENTADAAFMLLTFAKQFEAVMATREAAMNITTAEAEQHQLEMEAVKADLLSGNVNQAIRRYRRAIEKMAAKSSKAAEAIKMLRRKEDNLINELEGLNRMQELVTAIRQDPAYRTLGEHLAEDTRLLAPIDIFDEANDTIRLTAFPGQPEVVLQLGPSKEAAHKAFEAVNAYSQNALRYLANKDSNLDYDPFLGRSLAFFLENRAEILKSRGLLPENPGLLPSFAFQLFKHGADFVFNSSTIPYFIKFFGRGMGFDRLSETIEAGSKIQKLAQRVYELMYPRSDELLYKARTAHGIPTIGEYWEKVFNRLAYSRQYHQLKALKVGDPIGNGYRVTQADLDVLNDQVAFHQGLAAAIRSQQGVAGAVSQGTPQARGIKEESPNLHFYFRDALATGPQTLSRNFGRVFRWLEQMDAGRNLEQFVNQHADTLLFGYINWANEATNLNTRYKYAAELKDIQRESLADNEPVQSVDELAQLIYDAKVKEAEDAEEEIEIPTTAEIKRTILGEIDTMLRRVRDYREALRQELTDPGEQKFALTSGVSSLTKARGDMIMPGEWYDYGTLGKDTMLAQVSNASKPSFIEMAKLLNAMVRKLQAKVDELERSGLTEQQLRERRKAGEDFMSADEAREALSQLKKIQTWLGKIEANHGNIETRSFGGIGRMDNNWRVVMRLATAAALTKGASMINNLFGGGFMTAFLRTNLDIPSQSIADFADGSIATSSAWGSFRSIPASYAALRDLVKTTAERTTLTMTEMLAYMTGKAATATQIKAIQKMNEYVTASLLEQRRQWQLFQEIGLDSNIQLRERFLNYLRLFETGGESIDTIKELGPSRAKPKGLLARLARHPAQAFKAGALAASEGMGQLGVSWVDSVINKFAGGRIAADYELLMQALAHQTMPAKVQAAEQGGYDWRDTSRQENFWTPSEIAHNKGVDAEKVGLGRRDLVRQTGATWEQLMTDYWSRYTDWVQGGKQGTPPRFLKNDAQRNGLMVAIANRTNYSDFSNRPMSSHAGGMQEFAGYLYGWPMWAAQEMAAAFGAPSNRTTKQLRPDITSLSTMTQLMSLAIPMAILSMMAMTLRDYYSDLYKKYKIKALSPRYLAEKALAGEPIDPVVAAKITASSMANFIPFFGAVMNNWLDNASRNGYDLNSQIFGLNLANDMYNTIREVGETGDPIYSLLRFGSRWLLPDTAVRAMPSVLPIEATRTLEGALGNRTANNLAAQAASLADIENRRNLTGQSTFRYTEATPLIRGWLAAMATGDDASRADFFNRLVEQKRADIIAKHPEIDPGQADTDARAAALSSLRSRHPFVTALGRMPTEQEYNTMMGKLTPENREKLTAYMAGYDRAIQQDSGGTATVRSFTTPAGGSVTTFRAPAGGGGTGLGASGGGGRLPSGGGGGQTLSTGRVGSGMSLPSGVPTIGRAGLPRLGRFNVARRVAAAPRTRLPRLRLTRLKLPKLSARMKRPRLPRSGGRLLAMKKPRLRRTTLA